MDKIKRINILKKLNKMIIAIFIIILLEVTVFNFRYYTTKFSGLEKEMIEVTQENVVKNRYQGYETIKEYKININKKVKGIKLNIYVDEPDKDVQIDTVFTDASAKNARKELDSITYNEKYRKIEYIVLNSQGECIELNLKCTSESFFSVRGIEINTWYFEFNIYRVAILFIVSLIILYRKEINEFFEKDEKRKKYAYIWFILIVVILYELYAMGYGKTYENFVSYDEKVYKDPYKLLTESIMEGKISLDFPTKYKEQLTELENYKDYSEKVFSNIPYLFDVAFYEGNYYCYYGIVPVLTVMLPIAMLTGICCYSNIACIIYAAITIILLHVIYQKLLKKFNIKLSFIIEFIGFLVLVLTTGIYLCMFQPNFYQAADLSAMAWGLLALLLILNLENNNKTRFKLCFIGISYGLVVCSRPIYVFYIIPIVICVWEYIFKNKKVDIKNGLAFAIPIIIIALLQMWYNYTRFDNPLEFGQFYQLTINDPSEQQVETGMSIEGVLSYLFNPPIFNREYPFVGFNDSGVNNGNIIYSETIYGLVWYPYLLILLFFKNRAKNKEYRKKLMAITISMIVIGIIMLVLNTCWAGMNQRYLVDILPILSILALINWLMYINESKNEEAKAERLKTYKICCLIAFIVMNMYALPRLEPRALEAGEFKNIDKEVVQYEIKHLLEFYK